MILTPSNCTTIAVLIVAASVGMYVLGVINGMRHERAINDLALRRLWLKLRDSDTCPDALNLISMLVRGERRGRKRK